MNLIVCCTPLQVLIAEKIIELHPDEEFYGVMITPVFNNKYQYYFKKLSKKCQRVHLITTSNYSKFLIYLNVIKVKFLFHNCSFNRIFIANINDSVVQAIVSKFHKSKLYTFDDGTLNITEANFGTSKFESPIKKILRVLFNFGETIDSLKKRSSLHYTIYPNMPNIISNIQVIKLLEKKESYNIYDDSPAIKIMLGQPIFNDISKNQEIINEVIKKFNIEYYFPHPRELYQIEGVKYIDTCLIFEDYFIENLTNKNCLVYTFCSTSVLNIENINPIVIQSEELRIMAHQTYKIFDQFNFNMVSI